MSAKEKRKYVKLYHEEFRLDTKKISEYKNEKDFIFIKDTICLGIGKLCSYEYIISWPRCMVLIFSYETL